MTEKQELTRAELVRLRREQKHVKHMERAVRDATRPVPLITTRSNQAVIAPKRRSSRSTRRRFQIALPASGSDFRTVSIPRPHVGMRLISFLIVALLGTALYFAFNLPQLRVTQAQITGNQMLSPADINSALNVAGQPIFLLTPADLETRLRLNLPELVSVKVTVAFPNLVSVNVTERQPIIRWEQGDGYTWISEDGVAFRPHEETPGLIPVVALSAPPVEGNVSPDSLTPAPFISSSMVQALEGLVAHVPPGTPILYDASFGFGWNDARGWRVYFGTSSSDVELKMRVYESMVSSLTQRGIQPVLINVTYPTAPYYRISQ